MGHSRHFRDRYKDAMDAAPQQFKEFAECLDQNA